MTARDLDWHKSSYSNNTGGECVEVAQTAHSAYVRDTQNRNLGHLGFSAEEWRAFLCDVNSGRW